MSEKISWETVMVYNILKNLVYTGTLVSRKMKSCGVGSKKRVVNEPIIVEGTHEAIISKEDFELAQKVIRGGGRNPTRKQHDYPLKGLVRCGNCKRAMTRRKNKAGIRYSNGGMQDVAVWGVATDILALLHHLDFCR